MHVFPHKDVPQRHIRCFSLGASNKYSVTGIRLRFSDFPTAELTFDRKSGIVDQFEGLPAHVRLIAIMRPQETDVFG